MIREIKFATDVAQRLKKIDKTAANVKEYIPQKDQNLDYS